jgi:hypothetical protein
MIDEMPPIRRLHADYQDATGLITTLTMTKISMWRAWMAMGWNRDDLILVVRMLHRKIEDRARLVRSMRFEWFIGNVERFDGDLSEARALDRAPKVCPGKASVLRATHRPAQQFFADTVKSAEDVMKANAGLAALLKLRDEL